jgi:K+-sensing histidine kinase KdpD
LVQRALSGQMVRMADLANSPNLQLRPEDERGAAVHSLIGIPITSRTGHQHGGLFLIHSQVNAFDETQERLAIGLARRASIVIENASLYSEAREIQEELRRSNVAKDEFIGVISHELRTPITTIYGGARLLQTRRKTLPEEATEEMITSIEEESERLYRLVENLLAIARTDLGYEFAKEIINVDAVIDQVVKQFTNRHPVRHIELLIQEDLPAAVGESAYLHQVINNLVSNADKYSPAGLTIEIEAKATRTEVEVHVMDHGPGVPADEMEQIFESFYRSQRTARQASGKGLGLTVCKRLMEAMSGRIWARQREGGGLAVSVALPLAAELPEDEPPAEEPET